MPVVSTKEETKRGSRFHFSHRARTAQSLPHQELGTESINHAIGLFQSTKSEHQPNKKPTLNKIHLLRQTRERHLILQLLYYAYTASTAWLF